jgi:hypothetical protein
VRKTLIVRRACTFVLVPAGERQRRRQAAKNRYIYRSHHGCRCLLPGQTVVFAKCRRMGQHETRELRFLRHLVDRFFDGLLHHLFHCRRHLFFFERFFACTQHDAFDGSL